MVLRILPFKAVDELGFEDLFDGLLGCLPVLPEEQLLGGHVIFLETADWSEETHWLHINVVFVNFADLVLYQADQVGSQAQIFCQLLHWGFPLGLVDVVKDQFEVSLLV